MKPLNNLLAVRKVKIVLETFFLAKEKKKNRKGKKKQLFSRGIGGLLEIFVNVCNTSKHSIFL